MVIFWAEFIHMLDAIRFGRLTPQIIAAVEKLKRRVVYDDGIEPTELYVSIHLYRNTLLSTFTLTS